MSSRHTAHSAPPTSPSPSFASANSSSSTAESPRDLFPTLTLDFPMSKVWGGAWALDAERAEAKEQERAAYEASNPPVLAGQSAQSFPSLKEATSGKPKKKKTATMTLTTRPISLSLSLSLSLARANFRVFVSTWNVGGVPPTDNLELEDWLDTKNNTYDIYVLGFQEIVALSAKNVLGAEKSKVAMQWNSLIRAALNKSLSNSQRCEELKVGEKVKVYPVKDGCNFTTQDFRCIISKQMVGLLVSVWVRGDLRRYIRYPSVSCIGCGIMSCLGNKEEKKEMKCIGIQMLWRSSQGLVSQEDLFLINQ